jgi:hypothetical protein
VEFDDGHVQVSMICQALGAGIIAQFGNAHPLKWNASRSSLDIYMPAYTAITPREIPVCSCRARTAPPYMQERGPVGCGAVCPLSARLW